MKSHSLVNAIINRRTMIEKVFVILVIVSVICFPFVGVNYDLSKYLPDYAPSKVGLDIMEEEFGYPGTARIMIKDVSINEAKIYKDRIENVDGVDMVSWCDTTTDVYQSNLFIKYNDIEDYYKDGYAVMDVTFDESDSSKLTHKAIDAIKQMTGDRGYFTGAAVQNKSLSETLTREITIALIMGIFMIWAILTVTTTSWFEPFMFLLIMAVAIIINMGSNIFLGTISFLTFSMAAILQLAIAMDYSIFLLHSFTREKAAGLEPEQALANALRSSVVSILSSGATTVVGFIVLTLMNFTIGKDLGIVLAKGIVISLITVLFLMPALIMRWQERIEKTAHKSFMPSFRPLGEKIYKIRYFVLAFVLVVVYPAFIAQGMSTFFYGNDALGSSEGTKVYEDEKEINAHFGRSNLILALVPNTNRVTEKKLSDELDDLYYTRSVTSLANKLPDGVPESIVPESITSKLHTKNYARLLISIRTANESDMAFQCTDEIKAIVKKYYPDDSHVVGVTPSTQDIKYIITDDYNFVNILSLLGVAFVVWLTFKSGIIAAVVMMPIEVAIFINMAIPYLMGEKMLYMGYIIVSCLQLGATVDYSILLTNNYLDKRIEYDKKEAAIQAITMSALSVLTSGTILTIVGYGLYFISSVVAIADMGHLIGRGALLSMILVLTMLPMLLTIFDKIIFDMKKRVDKLEKLHKSNMKKFELSIRNKRKLRKKQIKALLSKGTKLKFKGDKAANQSSESEEAIEKNQDDELVGVSSAVKQNDGDNNVTTKGDDSNEIKK